MQDVADLPSMQATWELINRHADAPPEELQQHLNDHYATKGVCYCRTREAIVSAAKSQAGWVGTDGSSYDLELNAIRTRLEALGERL